MRKSRFTEEQIVSALKEHEAGASTGELCRRLGIVQETLYRWKRKYGGLDVSEARRLRTLEEENDRLKRIVADQALDILCLKKLVGKKLLTPAARREAARYLMERRDPSFGGAHIGNLGATRTIGAVLQSIAQLPLKGEIPLSCIARNSGRMKQRNIL